MMPDNGLFKNVLFKHHEKHFHLCSIFLLFYNDVEYHYIILKKLTFSIVILYISIICKYTKAYFTCICKVHPLVTHLKLFTIMVDLIPEWLRDENLPALMK